MLAAVAGAAPIPPHPVCKQLAAVLSHPYTATRCLQVHTARLMAGWKQHDDGRCTYHGKTQPCPASLSQEPGAADDELPAVRLAPKLVPQIPEEEQQQQHGQRVDAAADAAADTYGSHDK